MKLNLGAGIFELAGYENLYGKYGNTVYPLEYREVDVIRASHLLEHFSTDESIEVLGHWVDCLAPGGIIRIAVPDFDDLIRRKNLGEQLNYEGIIMGGQTDERDYHKSLWTHGKLRFIMEHLGLVEIQTWHSEIADCASFNFSLNLQGTKPCQK